jgi:membrane protease YdiL (CAAX protease family)
VIRRTTVWRPLAPPAELAGIALVAVLVLVLSGVRDAGTHPAGMVGATVALMLLALAGQRRWGVRVAVGPWRAGLVMGLVGAAVLVALPILWHGSPWHARAALMAAAAGLAISEEVVQRGLFFGLLERAGAGAGIAIAGSAALFALSHAWTYDLPAAAPLLLAAGAWLGYLRWAGGGLLAPVLAHVLADVLAAAA